MKIFLTGGSGVIGTRALAALVAAGHQVTAQVRSKASASVVTDLGAAPCSVDLFDVSRIGSAVAAHDAIVNLATKIPPPSQAARSSSWKESDRLRREGSRNLVDAALAAGIGRFVQESIAFIYPDSGDRWIDEDVALDPPALGLANQAAEAQALRFQEGGGSAVVLRFGQFYAAGSMHTEYFRRMARFRLPAMLGPKDAYCSSIAADDAAAAVVHSLQVPTGIWNVCDDEPLSRQRFNRAVADSVGAKPPLLTGEWLMGLSANTRFYLRSQRVSNHRFKEATGWRPQFPSAVQGWAQLAEGAV